MKRNEVKVGGHYRAQVSGVLTTVRVAAEHTGGGLGRMLVQGMARDLVHRGGVRALVAPDWVSKQRVKPMPSTVASIRAIQEDVERAGIRLDNEPLPDFLKRTGLTGQFTDQSAKRSKNFLERLERPAKGAFGGRCEKVFVIGLGF